MKTYIEVLMLHNNEHIHRSIDVNPNFAKTCIKRLTVICDLIGLLGFLATIEPLSS